MPEIVYDDAYYDALRCGSRRSAERVLPILFERLQPGSVVDFGCGTAEWLAVAETLGADVYGVDGPWISPRTLRIPADRFVAADLAAPIDLGRQFGLAICLEVAEHLPATSADTLIATLTRHAPAVLFSAALPGQGGTDHVNEQWPGGWAERFEAAGFVCRDPRAAIWDDAAIEPWYRQNLLVFARKGHPLLAALSGIQGASPARSLVHPQIWTERLSALDAAQSELVAAKGEAERLGTEWQRLADENAAMARTIDEITASRSWRLTAPLRWIDTRLRRRR